MDTATAPAPPARGKAGQSRPPGHRHAFATRLWHWSNAVTLAVMLMSGLMIFNAHPRLYWGHYGANPDPAWLDWSGGDGIPFPGWITLPSFYSLADARLWHLAFAWLFAALVAGYLLWGLLSGHLRRRIVPGRAEFAPGHLLREVADHARLRFPPGAAALRYNTLQKLSYGAVLLVLLPGMVLTGLGMSPAIDAGFPVLVDLLGGRQSARSLHFIGMALLALFFAAHIAMVLLSGPLDQLRAMITGGRSVTDKEKQP